MINLNSNQTANATLIHWYWIFWGFLICIAVFSGTLEYHHIYVIASIIAGHFAVRAFVARPDGYRAFFMLTVLMYLIYYCAQPLLPIANYVSPLLGLVVVGTERSREVVSQFVFLGLFSFIVVGLAFAPPSRTTGTIRRLNEINAWTILGFALLISLSVLGLKVGLESLSLLYIPGLIAKFAVAVLLVQYFKGLLSFRKRLALAVVLFLLIVVAIASGLVAEVLRIILMIVFVFVLVKKRLPHVGVFLFAFVCAFPLLMFKGLYRELYWLDPSGGSASFLDSVRNTFGFFAVIASNLDASSLIDLINAAALRVGMSQTFDYVATWTPNYIPYWGGSSYYPLIFKIIPRVFLDAKPLEDMGQVFGHQYYFLDELDIYSSVNLPILVEIYLNFGFIGAPFCMAILALVNIAVFRFIEFSLKTPETQIAAKATFFIGVANIESNFSLVYGGIPYTLIILWVCDKFMARRGASAGPV